MNAGNDTIKLNTILANLVIRVVWYILVLLFKIYKKNPCLRDNIVFFHFIYDISDKIYDNTYKFNININDKSMYY